MLLWIIFGVFLLLVLFIVVASIVDYIKETHDQRVTQRIKRLDRKSSKLRIKLKAYREIKELRR